VDEQCRRSAALHRVRDDRGSVHLVIRHKLGSVVDDCFFD
jgi:hypothetical protein